MSIEQNLADLTAAVNNLADLTAAVNNLTAVLQSKMMAGTVGNDAAAINKAIHQEAPKKDTPKPQKEAAAASAPPAAIQATQATTDAASGDKPIDFTSQVQKPIVAMAAGGKREQALAILKELGAARASDIKPEDYAKAVELIAKAG